MVIGFKKQFVEPILQGTKVHTIRDDKKGRWKAGMTMHMYTGGRYSKEYHQFDEKVCTSVQQIDMFIEYDETTDLPILRVFIESDSDFSFFNFDAFAKRDGFESVEAFVNWWRPVVQAMPNEKFTGKIIHWTNLKY